VNERLDSGKSKETAFASAWAAFKNAGYEKQDGEWVKKRSVDDDVFTTEIEAEARSNAMGFGGKIYSHDTAEVQKVYMPGETHEEYMQGPESEAENPGKVREVARAIMETVLGKNSKAEETNFTVASNITKVDEDKRLVTGWASVIEEDGEAVVDKQGDMITEDELVKAAHNFISEHRAAKSMHEGERIGQVVESMVFTNELQKQLGVDMGKVGWLITMKIDDDETWKRVKSGEFKGFSIGGKAKRVQA